MAEKDLDYKAMFEQQSASIAALQQQLALVASRLPAVEEPDVTPGGQYPFALYKQGHKKGQVDHPGNLVKVVKTEAALVAAKADGWREEPYPFLDLEDAEAMAAEAAKEKRAAKKASKA